MVIINKGILFGLLLTLALSTRAEKLEKQSENVKPESTNKSTESTEEDASESKSETETKGKGASKEEPDEAENETAEAEPEGAIAAVVETAGDVHTITKRAIRIKGFGKLLNRFTIKCEKNSKCKKYCKKHYKHATGKCMKLKTRISTSSKYHFTSKTQKVCGCTNKKDD